MAIDKYVCPTFEEGIEPKQLIKRVLNSHHSGGYERKFFEGLLETVNETHLRIALIDGVVKGSPMDPSPDNPLTKKLKWVAFHPQWGKEWEVLRHIGYMLIPYNRQVEPVTPLLSVEFHTRRYVGGDTDFISHGHVQTINRIRYDQGRTQPIMLEYDPQGAEQRKKQRIKEGVYDPNDELGKTLDNFEMDLLNAPELGPAHITPFGISSGLTRDLRYRICEYINMKGNQFPQGWGEADFYELSYSSVASRAGLPQDPNDDLNMMEGFYLNRKIEFVDVSKIKGK